MTQVRKARTFAWKRRWLTAGLLVLAISLTGAMLAAGASGSKAPSAAAHNSLLAVASTTDSCGYPFGTGLTATTFNESTVLKGFSTTNITNPSTATVNIFYMDEWELNLGEAPITNWQKTYLKSGSTTIYADDAGSNPSNVGNGSARTTLLTGGGVDPQGRPKAPAVFVSDVTGQQGVTKSTPEPGDWQKGGSAQTPSFVAGQWKADGAPHNGQVTTIVNGKSTTTGTAVAANGKFLGPHADAFDTSINTSAEQYGDEIRYDVATLLDENGTAVKPGHTYKVQMMIHDGDHVSDTGEACTLVHIPKSPSTTNTTPNVKISDTVNLSIDTTTNANASVKSGDTVTVQLFQSNPTASSGTGCIATGTGANASGGTGAAQLGNTKTITIDTDPNSPGFNFANGTLSASLTYPDDFGGANAPALTNGKYWWYVAYSGNDEVDGSNDGCTETFALNSSLLGAQP